MKDTAVIFDFDGVLVDSFDFHLANMTELFGRAVDPEEYRDIHKGNFFTTVGNTSLADVDWLTYQGFMRPRMGRQPLITDMESVVRRFIRQDRCLFVVSSGCAETIGDFLVHNGIHDTFHDVLGMQTCKTKIAKFAKITQDYGIPAQRSVYITDTVGDILEARSAGVASIAVTWGFHDEATLAQSNPWAVAHTPNDLVPLVERFFGPSVRHSRMRAVTHST